MDENPTYSSLDGSGVCSISGTIGKPDAGPTMTNGAYVCVGGFWALPKAVQTEAELTLTIISTSTGQAHISSMPDSIN